MKLKLTAILFLTCLYSQIHAQYTSNNMQRKAPNKGIQKIEITTHDTVGDPYISEIKLFNSEGYITDDLELSETGDTLSYYHASFPDKWSEIRVWKQKDGFDTCYYYYNKKNNLTKMRWVPHDDESEVSFYYYDKKDRIIIVDEVYWRRTYSFVYKNDQLDQIINRKLNMMIDSTVFTYNEKGLNTGYKKFDRKNILKSIISKKYNDRSQVIQEEHDYIDEKDKSYYLSTITYGKNGNESGRTTLMYINGKIEETWQYTRDEKGMLKSWTCTYPTGKIVSYYSKIYTK
jgi:hypothetical protein